MRKTISIMLMTAIALILSGCGEKVFGPLVNKTFSVVSSVEGYVQSIESAKLVQNVEILNAPLSIAKQASDYLASQVDEPTKSNILKVSEVLATLSFIAENISIDNVEEQRQKFLDSIAEVKSEIAKVADRLGVAIADPKSRGVAERSLSTFTEELEAELNKLRSE